MKKPNRRSRRRAGAMLCAGLTIGTVCGGAAAQAGAPDNAASGAAVSGAPLAAAPATPAVLPAIVVVGTTPLLGIGTPLPKVPANVQTVRAEDIAAQHR